MQDALPTRPEAENTDNEAVSAMLGIQILAHLSCLPSVINSTVMARYMPHLLQARSATGILCHLSGVLVGVRELSLQADMVALKLGYCMPHCGGFKWVDELPAQILLVHKLLCRPWIDLPPPQDVVFTGYGYQPRLQMGYASTSKTSLQKNDRNLKAW